MNFGEENFSAWGMPKKKRRSKNDYPEPVEYKTRLGEINELLDKRIDQKKALDEANKIKGSKKLISEINKTIIEIDKELYKLR